MIDGVITKDLVTHQDERGFFREVFRFQCENENIPVGQLSHSLVNKGIVKAWHGHKFQSQWNYVVSGKIRVKLFDNREYSTTKGELLDFQCGEGEAIKAYYFPPGVLHGYRCLKGPMNIMYATSDVYDLYDEVRISSLDIGVDFLDK